MTDADRQMLELLQCERSREKEETFARVLCEDDSLHLFFINDSRVWTDGKNIILDPALGNHFADREALRRTEEYMGLPPSFSRDSFLALKMLTRGRNIHECLHIIFSDFSPHCIEDSRASTKARRLTLAKIDNIIEDAFIEAAGCSEFDNMELFLMFSRVVTLFANTPTEGTVNRAFREELGVAAEVKSPLRDYLNYMAVYLLYPMIVQGEPPEEIASFVEKTRPLFSEGSVCPDASRRYDYTRRIFDIIEPLIPESEEDIDTSVLERIMPGTGRNIGDTGSLSKISRKARRVVITRRLFTGKDGEPLSSPDFVARCAELTEEFEWEKSALLSLQLQGPSVTEYSGEQFDCHSIHRDIRLIETKPAPNPLLRRAYKNIYDKYRLNINSYNSRFAQLLKSFVPVREEGRLFGSGISSRRLADPKRRCWYRTGSEPGIPDLAVLLLIDGSGSMFGSRRESAMVSALILHEVLKKQGIEHAIVEHRAVYGESEVYHNILVDFQSRDGEKYNLLTLDADEGTREGLSLFWAERYLLEHSYSEHRLILVLSDGVPYHFSDYEEDYAPPVSTMDTKNAAAKIVKRGTKIIAVALDDAEDDKCYDELRDIYPTVIECSDLSRLTGQLLGVISRQLR